jgi:RNA polymerase sigma-70 factor (ECF subfamily)
MLRREEILLDEEAQEIITELYETGHGLADFAIEQILGTQLSKMEREDLVQDGFVRMITHVESLRKKSIKEQLSYMYSVMRNVAIDEGRKRSKRKLLMYLDSDDCLELPSTDLTPEELCMMQTDIADKKRRLYAALERLDERDRALLIEKYKNGLSDSEIGLKLGIKARNVRVYLARARRKAAIYYGEQVDEEKRNKQAKDKPDEKDKPDGGEGAKEM